MTQPKARHFNVSPLRANGLLDVYSIKDLVDTSPPYQRLAIWERTVQQLFIDSIINGMDIPKLYFHDVRHKNDQYIYSIIDGKQRFLALCEFVDNVYPLASNFICFDNPTLSAGGKYFKDLLAEFPSLYGRVITFELPVIVVSSDDERLIEMLFTRLNVQKPLSAPEGRNALGGPLPYLIRKIAAHGFFRECIKIPNNRYQHLDLAVKFLYLSLMQEFQSVKKETLDKFVKDHHDVSAGNERIETIQMTCTAILDHMLDFFREADKSLLSSQGRIILYFHLFRLYTTQGEHPRFDSTDIVRFKVDVDMARKKSQRLAEGQPEGDLSAKEHDLLAFDREKQSPNDGGALKRQYTLIKRYFEQEFARILPEPD